MRQRGLRFQLDCAATCTVLAQCVPLPVLAGTTCGGESTRHRRDLYGLNRFFAEVDRWHNPCNQGLAKLPHRVCMWDRHTNLTILETR